MWGVDQVNLLIQAMLLGSQDTDTEHSDRQWKIISVEKNERKKTLGLF